MDDETVERLARDMWYGNGKPGIATRVESCERDIIMLKGEIYGNGSKDGVCDTLKKYIARQEGRDAEVKETLSKRDKMINIWLTVITVLIALAGLLHELEQHHVISQVPTVTQGQNADSWKLRGAN